MDLALNYSNAARGTPAFNDLLIVNGDLALVDSQAAIVEAILQRFRFFRGEWFLDTTEGLPYLPQLFTQPNVSLVFEQQLQAVVTTTPGVQSLLAWNTVYDRDQRNVTVSFRAATIHGEVVWSQAISV